MDTYLVGYLSAGEIIAEGGRARLLKAALPPEAELPRATWDAYQERVLAEATSAEHPPLLAALGNFRMHNAGATVAEFAHHLAAALPLLEARERTLAEVRRKAMRNQDIYLTWDHMDV